MLGILGGSDRKVKLWETVGNGAELRAILTGCNGAIFSVEFDSTGTLLLCTSSDFACRVWTVDDHRLRVQLLIFLNLLLCPAFVIVFVLYMCELSSISKYYILAFVDCLHQKDCFEIANLNHQNHKNK